MIKVYEQCQWCGQWPGVTRAGVVVDLHDCNYVRGVNAVLDEAEASANKTMSFKDLSPDDPAWAWEWDAVFHRAANRLAAEAGVRPNY